MASLQEVAEGLRKGLAFEHVIDDDGGKKYVIPKDDQEFYCIIDGLSGGGYGTKDTLMLKEAIGEQISGSAALATTFVKVASN